MFYRFLRTYLRPYNRYLVIVAFLVLLQSIANLYLPNLNADLINNGVSLGNIGYIWKIGLLMLGFTLVVGILAIIGIYFSSLTSMGTGRDLRAAVFKRVQHFSEHDMSHFGTPSLITRNTNDVQQLQLFLQMALTIMVSGPIMAIGGIIMALNEDVRLSALLIVSVPLIGVIIAIMLIKAVPLFRSMQVKIDRINLVLREQITGVRVIRAFLRNDYEQHRFQEANYDLTSTALRVNRIFVFAMPSMMVIMNLSTVAVLWFGGHLVGSGNMPIGNLTAFLNYIALVLSSVMMSTMMIILLPRAMASAQRIQDVLDTTSSVSDAATTIEPAKQTGVVNFKNVSFGYPGSEQHVLHNLTFTLEPGKTTAIIGGTGSGKTTLINLITRFYDVIEGELDVDEVDIRKQRLEGLWSRIALVPQAAYLFSGSIRDNLHFGSPAATDEQIWDALAIAQAKDFVTTMPKQLDEQIDQGGTNVSGGQRQRLSIARALIKKPQIYLFDDCFSALDAATDTRLRAALKATTGNATVVIVAQRVSTILHADRIIVLDSGKIVGIGTHHELMQSAEEYREIVQSQLGEGEVA